MIRKRTRTVPAGVEEGAHGVQQQLGAHFVEVRLGQHQAQVAAANVLGIQLVLLFRYQVKCTKGSGIAGKEQTNQDVLAVLLRRRAHERTICVWSSQ